MNQGKLVPDLLVSKIIEKRIKKKDCKDGFILDGFPRTLNQAEFLDKENINFDYVLNIIAHEQEIIKRLSGRRICKNCNAIYHIETIKPNNRLRCIDICIRVDLFIFFFFIFYYQLKDYHNRSKPLRTSDTC